jgi:hypothetical protein
MKSISPDNDPYSSVVKSDSDSKMQLSIATEIYERSTKSDKTVDHYF